ncbi:MAG: hypothetical protein ACRDRO_04280, partial [Pseudonocardiaceae bacterium]
APHRFFQDSPADAVASIRRSCQHETAALTHRLSLVVLMLFMAVFGLMSLLKDAAFQSFLPRLVPRCSSTR